jgi:hypothetical protein
MYPARTSLGAWRSEVKALQVDVAGDSPDLLTGNG